MPLQEAWGIRMPSSPAIEATVTVISGEQSLIRAQRQTWVQFPLQSHSSIHPLPWQSAARQPQESPRSKMATILKAQAVLIDFIIPQHQMS